MSEQNKMIVNGRFISTYINDSEWQHSSTHCKSGKLCGNLSNRSQYQKEEEQKGYPQTTKINWWENCDIANDQNPK